MSFLSKFSIHNKEELIKVIRQFIKFGMVGLSNTAISLGIYYLFVWINPELYIVGNTVGFIVSVLNAYYWNNKYVFQKSEKGHTKTLVKTFISYGGTFLLSTGLLVLMVQVFGIPETIAPLINLLVTIPVNFLLNKFWAFK